MRDSRASPLRRSHENTSYWPKQSLPLWQREKYKKCCLGKDESIASGHGAKGASSELRQALEGRQFNSLEEVQAFVKHRTHQQNQRSLDEFLAKEGVGEASS